MKKYLLSLSIFLLMHVFSANSQEVIFRSPSYYTKSFIQNDSLSLVSINHKNFRVYFKEGSYTSMHLDEVKEELDEAYYRILNLLGIKSYLYGVYLVAVDSKEEMQQLMGYKIKGGAAQGHDLVFFVYNEQIRPQFKHELFHLLSYEVWGPTAFRLLDEGAATYTDNFCFYDNPMYSINAYYLKEKMLFPLEKLVHQFDEQAKQSDVIAYIQSAGLVKYLYERYGLEKFKRLWTEGFENLEKIYGFTLQSLEKEWLHFIQGIPIPEGFDIQKLKEGCG